MRLSSARAWVGLWCLSFCPVVPAGEAAGVSPRPQVEDYGRELVRFETQAAPIRVSFKNTGPGESAACASGLRLLSKRLMQLGAGAATPEAREGRAQLQISKTSPAALSRFLRKQGAREAVAGKRLEQAYTLVCRPAYRNRGAIQITACSELGIYYGLVSLCQLLDKDANGGLCVPVARIADWPEIGLRLSKTSASTSPLSELYELLNWLPLYKLNVVGLQFHGTNSNEPEPFRQKVQAVCARARQGGILETIVYFCPFRGRGYDFNLPADQQRYAEFLQWMLDQGASGIEVDYNDWPGRGTPIENVINLACRAVAEKNPRAYVLYCPPSRGTSVYRGPASAEMIRILSLVPTNVWPLWTGSATNNALIEKPLNPADVEAWTRAAGRRPFLWVNRVGPRDRYNRPFMRPVSEVPGAFVFRGDYLPKDLNRLFEGVHFNAIPLSGSDREMLEYLATAADYVWNPRRWEAVDSCRRARRFVDIMLPLVEPVSAN
jgi:hypothetical protein